MNEYTRIGLYTQTRYKDIECGYCGAHVTLDLGYGGQELLTDPDPYAHEDDCPRAEWSDPR